MSSGQIYIAFDIFGGFGGRFAPETVRMTAWLAWSLQEGIMTLQLW